MKKRIICFLLAMILVLGLIPNAAVNANAYSVRNTSDKAIDILRGSATFYAKEQSNLIGYSTPADFVIDGETAAKVYKNGISKEDAVDLMRAYLEEEADELINDYVKSNNIDLNKNEHDALAVHFYRTGNIDALLETVRVIKTVSSAADRAAVVESFVAAYSHDPSSNEALQPTLDVSLAEAAMYLYGDYGYNGGSKLTFARLDTDHDFEGDAVAAYVKNDGYTLNPEGTDFLGWFLYDAKKEDITGAPLTKLTKDHSGKLIVAKQATGDNDPAKYTLNTKTLADLNVYSWTSADPEQTGKILKKDSKFKVTYEFLDSDGVKWVYGSGTSTKGKTVKGWVKVGVLEATDPETNKPIATATVTSSSLNIRPGATSSGNLPLGTLAKGDVVNIYEIKEEKTETGNQNWGKVVNVETTEGDFVTGWINLAFAEVNETLGESGEATGQTGKIANAAEVNIRKSDSVYSDKLTALKEGTKVTVLEMNADRTWAKIKWTNPSNGYTQGWVYMHYVHLDSAPDGSTGGSASLGEVKYTGVVTSNINLNVRKKADIYSTKVDSLPTGTKINVYETKTKNNMKWGKIGEDRWVCLAYVSLTEVPSGSGSGASTTTTIQGTVTAATLDVLKNYNNNAQKVGSLKKGDVVTILEKNTETTDTGSRIWGRINKDGLEGWINLAYVDVKNVTSVNGGNGSGTTSGTTNANGANAVISNCISVNIREGAGVSNKQITKLNNGTAVKVYEQVTKDNAPWARITWNNGANSGWVCMNYVTVNNGTVGSTTEGGLVNGTNSNTISATGYVNSNIDLNVRSIAGLNGIKLGSLKKGTKVTIYEQVTADGMIWGRMQYGNGSGWVCMSYISVESASSTGKGVMGTIARCFAAVNVRSAPGTGNALIGKINVGTRVEVFETRTYSGQLWGRVAQGWICMDYVLLDSELPEGEILDAPAPTTEAPEAEEPEVTVNKDNEVAYTITGTINTTETAINVRNDASTDSIRVGTVKNGETVKILALKNNNAKLWGRIDQFATAGWIRMDLVNYLVDGYVNTDNQPVFANPDTSSTVKENLSINTYLEITKMTVGGETVYGWVDDANGWIPMGRVSDDMVDVITVIKKGEETETMADEVLSGTTNSAADAVNVVNGSKVNFKLESGVKVSVGQIKLEAGIVWGNVEIIDNGDSVIGWINLAKVNYVLDANVDSDTMNVRSAKNTADDENILGSVESGAIKLCELSFDANGKLWGKVTGNANTELNGGYIMVTGHISY